MSKKTQLYICPVCFEISNTINDAHEHTMILCDYGEPGDERRKPVKDEFNHYVNPAPRWFLEAVGWVKAD